MTSLTSLAEVMIFARLKTIFPPIKIQGILRQNFRFRLWKRRRFELCDFSGSRGRPRRRLYVRTRRKSEKNARTLPRRLFTSTLMVLFCNHPFYLASYKHNHYI
jgi:hypothetical protein